MLPALRFHLRELRHRGVVGLMPGTVDLADTADTADIVGAAGSPLTRAAKRVPSPCGTPVPPRLEAAVRRSLMRGRDVEVRWEATSGIVSHRVAGEGGHRIVVRIHHHHPQSRHRESFAPLPKAGVGLAGLPPGDGRLGHPQRGRELTLAQVRDASHPRQVVGRTPRLPRHQRHCLWCVRLSRVCHPSGCPFRPHEPTLGPTTDTRFPSSATHRWHDRPSGPTDQSPTRRAGTRLGH
jgi:hypothetical protein